jgi:hypothetical protein
MLEQCMVAGSYLSSDSQHSCKVFMYKAVHTWTVLLLVSAIPTMMGLERLTHTYELCLNGQPQGNSRERKSMSGLAQEVPQRFRGCGDTP